MKNLTKKILIKKMMINSLAVVKSLVRTTIGCKFKFSKIRKISNPSYDSFSEKDLLPFFDKFTSGLIVNLRDEIHFYHHPNEKLCFSLETISGNEYTSKISKFPKVDKDGHTGTTIIHSMQVLSSIRKLEFSNWKKYSLKLGYSFCFDSFYFLGFTNLPFLLMSIKLTDDNKLIKSLSEELNNEEIPIKEREKILFSNLNKFQKENPELRIILNKPKKYLF